MIQNRKVALLRGINVGGHKKFPKADQLTMLDALGFLERDVYLHTGNWVFNTSKNPAEIQEEISATIKKKYGWEVPVLVFTASEVQKIYNNCPFPEAIKEKSYFTLLGKTPAKALVENLRTFTYPGEAYHITDRCIYFYPSMGAGRAKMNNNFFENKLKVTATSRNYNTMSKIAAMLTGI